MSFAGVLRWRTRRPRLKRWSDAIFFGVLILTLVAAGQVRDAVQARDDAKQCMESAAWVFPQVPACAGPLLQSQGRFFDVALSVGQTSAQMVDQAGQRGEKAQGPWCALQAQSIRLYEERSWWSRSVQSFWISSQDERAIYLAARPCQILSASRPQ